MNRYLTDVFNSLGIQADNDKLIRFEAYCRLLLEKNTVMNLTAITEPAHVYIRHFADSVNLLALYDFKNKTVIDVGSGAGFPGLALKIAEPSISLTLLDSNRKRVKFLSETASSLGLEDVDCIHARAEEQAQNKNHRESFDIAVSRAVAPLSELCELSLPFVSASGVFIAMKALDCLDEVKASESAVKALGGRLVGKRDYYLAGAERQNSAVIIEKTHSTPDIYPRRYAKIKKRPL